MKKIFATAATGRAALFASAGLAALAVAGSPLHAQVAETAAAEEQLLDCPDADGDGACDPAGADGDTDGTILVTGSRIGRPELESTTPVTVLTGEAFFNQGTVNVGDTLNDLPQLRSTFGQTNAGRFLGTTGLNLLDLRGLDTVRTLVLVNGRRHVASDILGDGTGVDVNTIPADLISRVDVVTGGNSAIYGSDAIAGVVNFIMREDFEGVQVRGQAGINEDGQFPSQYISALAGRNFADGRGNVVLHAEYANQSRVYGSNVDFLRRNDGFLVIDADTANLRNGVPTAGTSLIPNGSDGFPDRAFFRDIRSAAIFVNGLVPINQPATGNRCGTGTLANNGASNNNGVPFNCTYLFQADGTLIEQTGTRLGTGPIGAIVGGNGPTGREGTLLTILPDQQRVNVNLLAHFEVTPAFEPFIEAKYVNIKTQGQQSTPAFIQGRTLGDDRERPRLDNPFLSAQARTTISNALLTSGFGSELSTRPQLTQANRDAIANGSFRFTVARFLQDLGNRDEQSERETYRIVGGVRGDFADTFKYELSVNYGKTSEDTTILGNILPQRFLLAIDAVRDPATGRIVCRSQIDPAARIAYDSEEALAADVAACVPYNPFGAADNSAAAAYIVEETVSRANLEQFVVSGFVSGDSSSFLELPGGPIGVAVGAEYRREKLFYRADPLVEEGRTFYNALPTFDPEPFEVKEAFGEIRIPLIADVPFIDELTVSGAIRASDYTGPIGTTLAYNAGVEWQIVPDLRIRGQYGRSVRAPNLSETAFPLTQNFAPGFADPCLPQNIGNNPNRPGNCAADLGALLTNPDFITLPAYSLEFRSGSNPLLTEESSDSYTIGAVFQPRFAPGFSLTVDYYDIRVNDVITAVGAQALVNTCYDLPTIDNPFCALINRFEGPGRGPNGEVPGQILEGDLTVAGVNFAARTVRGIDVEAAYSRSFGEDNRIATRFIYTHLFERSNFENPTTPDFENRILGELGDPQDEFRWNVDLKLGDVNLGYRMQYIGPQVLNLFEDINPLPGATTPAGTPPNNLDWADQEEYPEVFYHDIRVALELEDRFELTLGVDNLLDTNPPLGLTAVGGGSAIYRVRGRNYYAGFLAKF